MVTLRKKIVKGKTYYYLEHSVKIDGKVVNKSKYVGTKFPKDAEKMKSDFLWQIYSEKWFKRLDKVKENYSKELKRMPKAVQDKFLQDFMVRFTYNSNKIEGSSLSLRDNASLLMDGISPREKPISDIKEAENHKKTFYTMLGHKKDLSLQTVLFWHKGLLVRDAPERMPP